MFLVECGRSAPLGDDPPAPAKAIFWAMDEASISLTLLQYAKCLYGQQDAILPNRIFPVLRPLERQSYNQLELKDGGILIALPGKDPDRIRSEHPTIVIVDEAAFMENEGEPLDVALSSRVPKMMCISSAAPVGSTKYTESCAYYPTRGISGTLHPTFSSCL